MRDKAQGGGGTLNLSYLLQDLKSDVENAMCMRTDGRAHAGWRNCNIYTKSPNFDP